MTVETPAPPQVAPPEAPAQWKVGDPTPKLNKALSQLQGDVPRIKKTKTGEIKGVSPKTGEKYQYEYKYADLGDVVADVGPLLAKYGLSFHGKPTINPADRREMLLIWKLKHESGEEEIGEWPLGPVNQKPQDLGSALTYARRYSFTAATNIVLEDDDDGQRAQQAHHGRSAGDAWEGASKDRPQGKARGDRQDGPRPDAVAQALAKLAVQLAADTSMRIADINERVLKMAQEKDKLNTLVDNPFGDGRVPLKDVIAEAVKRMEAAPPEHEHGHGPAAEQPADGEPASAAADPSDPETAFVIAYMARVAEASEDNQLTAMRPEIGVAVKEKTISPKVAGELSAAVSARRRELAERVAS